MDPFFRLLWRHVLALEIFAECFPNGKKGPALEMYDKIKATFSDQAKRSREAQARYDALLECEDDFWIDSDNKIKEIVSKCEKDLGAILSAKLGIELTKLESAISANIKITEEQRKEIVARGQEIISKPLIKVLKGLYSVVDTVIRDQKKSFYIVIDQLDEDWAEDSIRYKLILALVNAVKECGSLKNIKLIIAMRKDLIDRVFNNPAKGERQGEKYKSFYLRIVWSKKSLIEILDKRINQLVKPRYTKSILKHTDLLPKKYSKENITKYISERVVTPRDIIDLFNQCILNCNSKTRLTTREFSLAEGEYSRSRLDALIDEWSSDYPDLESFVRVFKGLPPSFKVETINQKDLEEICLDISTKGNKPNTFLGNMAHGVAMGNISCDTFKITFLNIFYKIGIIGLKLSTTTKTSWADELGRSISVLELDQNMSVKVHKKYYRVLGIKIKQP